MKLPKAFQSRIIERFYSGKELASFVESYNEAKLRRNRSRTVNKTDLNILDDYRAGKLTSELARKYKMSISGINTSIRIAALSKI